MINGSDLGNIMRVLSCMGKRKFMDTFNTFGNDIAEHLYKKLHDDYQGNWAEFICYLDGDNLELLAEYIDKKLSNVD